MHPPRPFLIQMSGAPGSGKSTLARNLARSLNGTVISHDLIKSFFLENSISFEQSAKLTYDFQWALAKDLIEQGQATIIVDSTCNYQQTLAQGEALAQMHNYEYGYIECRVASLDILETRLQCRASIRSQRKTVTSAPIDATDSRHSEDYRTVFKRWIEHPFRPANKAILVDSSTSSPEECLDNALAQLMPLTSNDANSDLKSQTCSGSVKEVSINITTSSPAPSIESQRQSPVAALPASLLREQEQLDISDITAKFPSYWAVPVIDVKSFSPASGIPASVLWTILVRRNHLAERKISIDEISRQVLSKDTWSHGDTVIADLVVRTSFGRTVLVLAPRGTIESDLLAESGSSANVALVLGVHGIPEVQKSCSVEGIDGNGRPWLQRQLQFYGSSSAVRDTAIFVKPLRHTIATDTVSIAFPYVPSHTLAEMALAGMGSDALLGVVDNLLGEMAVDVWPRGCVIGPSDYVDQAQFRRMRRRVTIARTAIPQLDTILGYESIMLNGRRLLGFEQILKALSQHPAIKVINPKKLGEIHGDLNLHNILCQSASNGDRPVVLIDPRGVPLHFGFDATVGFEPGDYAYDISKLKFSLSGFSEIRKGYYILEGKDNLFSLQIKENPGSATLHSADQGLFEKLACNKRLLKWVDAVEHDGLNSLELRVLLGEAANYVADAACALGRNTIEEVLPLFLYGLAKLNDVLELVEGSTKQLPVELKTVSQSPNVGIALIQSALLASTDAVWPWDVLEVLVKCESTVAAHQLISGMVGEYLPERTHVYVSTHAASQVPSLPCVLIHPFVGVQGQTHAVLSSARRTQTFLCNNNVSQSTIDRLRIVTVTSTGSSTRSQYVARQNDKLLSPGPWGLSPLRLIVLEANQLTFPPTGGRWVVENDSYFVLSDTLYLGGDNLGLLTSKKLVTKSNSSWRVCIDSTHRSDAGLTFATSCREINTHEVETKFLRTTSAIFLPNHLAQHLVKMAGEDYAARTSGLLIDFVLPRFMARESWIELCHARGFGVDSDIAWGNGQRVAGLFPEVELADGGEEMVFHHFGSDVEYTNFIDDAGDDPLFSSLASLPSTAKWLRHLYASASRPSDEGFAWMDKEEQW